MHPSSPSTRPDLELERFGLEELSTPLDAWPSPRRNAYAEAARLDGAFLVDLPEAWRRVIGRMVERGHEVASRVLDAGGEFRSELDRFNEGSSSPIDPVWRADRTRPSDPEDFLPQRGLYVRLEKIWEVYEDPLLILGFLLKLYVRTQTLCRSLELLGIPPQRWREATGGAVDTAWLESAPARGRELDALASGAGAPPEEDAGSAFSAEVREACRRWSRECTCWHWCSLNFYFYDDGEQLDRMPIHRIEGDGASRYEATLLVEHADSDLVASVVNDQAGLEARDRAGRWRRVPSGSLLVNTGMTLQLLAGGEYRGGNVVGGSLRSIPHRVVVEGESPETVRRQLEGLVRRISIVGVTEPHGEEASLVTWDAEAGALRPVAGLEHCKFWQFLLRRVPPAPDAATAQG